jgi:hypothetical protein
VWAAGKRVPPRASKSCWHASYQVQSPIQKQNLGYDEHLKKVFDQKIDGYLTVFEELENNLLG